MPCWRTKVERVVDAGGRAHLAWIENTAAGPRQSLQEPEVSSWRLLGVWFLGLLPIESQL